MTGKLLPSVPKSPQGECDPSGDCGAPAGAEIILEEGSGRMGHDSSAQAPGGDTASPPQQSLNGVQVLSERREGLQEKATWQRDGKMWENRGSMVEFIRNRCTKLTRHLWSCLKLHSF